VHIQEYALGLNLLLLFGLWPAATCREQRTGCARSRRRHTNLWLMLAGHSLSSWQILCCPDFKQWNRLVLMLPPRPRYCTLMFVGVMVTSTSGCSQFNLVYGRNCCGPLRHGPHYVTDLAMYIDADVFTTTHAAKTVTEYFAALRQIRRVRCSITRLALMSLISVQWSRVALTMTVVCSRHYRTTQSTAWSLSWTLPHDWSVPHDSMIISCGYVYESISTLVLLLAFGYLLGWASSHLADAL
jgi:hypothetical protein